MIEWRSIRALLWAGSSLAAAMPLMAQPSAPAAPPTAAKRTYTPADFARFAPKTAYDMLAQVPSFTIRSADTSERGLGQASENVLINGQRIANKSGGAIDQSQRISAASVDRIEIVEAASLGIPGLSGQVANIILKSQTKGSGQFSWNPGFRAHFTQPQYDNASISYSNKTGPLDYTLSAAALSGRGGLGGPVTITDASHNIIETRDEIYHSEYHELVFKAKLGLDGPGSSLGNLALSYNPYWSPQFLGDTRVLATGERRSRTNRQSKAGYNADISGDYELALGPGRLKAIGLWHHEHAPNITTQILAFETTAAPSTGTRFSRDARYGEAIARGEYRWKTGNNDWQVSLERAFNSLDQRGGLFQLNSQGEFIQVPFPEGSGKVTEVRYEGIASLSRPLAPNLDLQLAAGAETSTLDRVDDDQPARKFFRPKGSVTLAWRPSKTWDISLKLRRRVGQIDFLDFLAQPVLSQDRQNAGNPELVPPQSWEAETEFSHDLGRWGKTRLNLHYYRVEDIIDVIPIGTDGQGIGNLPRAVKYGAESTSTLNLDPLGWHGAKIDLNAGVEISSVKDPLTGRNRPISGNYDRWGSAQLRHDVPGTPFAWGANVQYQHYAKNYFLTEIIRTLDIPLAFGAFVEHKNLLGLAVRASVFNIFGGRHGLHTVDRVVYSGFRDRSPIAFYEKHDDLVGPLFDLSIKGTF
ncbi:TonB-dependent receptor plug domain-containing protein [Sphingomonas sp.]|uniref:TonB-dependent receptor plug domain-containing protein n=1 Tax=Sphingomonas sp. TaxID=28214 RepID=UPI0038A8C85F